MHFFEWSTNMCSTACLWLFHHHEYHRHRCLRHHYHHHYHIAICICRERILISEAQEQIPNGCYNSWKEDCKWFTLWHSTQTLHWRSILSIFYKVSCTGVNIILFTSVRDVHPSLFWFSWNSPMFSGIICWSLVLNFIQVKINMVNVNRNLCICSSVKYGIHHSDFYWMHSYSRIYVEYSAQFTLNHIKGHKMWTKFNNKRN